MRMDFFKDKGHARHPELVLESLNFDEIGACKNHGLRYSAATALKHAVEARHTCKFVECHFWLAARGSWVWFASALAWAWG